MSTMLRGHSEDSSMTGECERESWHWCGEWWRRDRLHSAGWAAIFFWAALVLLAEAAGFSSRLGWWDGWGVFFTGVGAIALVEAVIRLLVAEYRSSWWWSLIVGSVLLGVGLDSWDGWAWVWALVMVAIGVVILRTVFPRGT